MTDDGAVALRIAGLEVCQRLVREHDAETECIIRPVALEHGDRVCGHAFFIRLAKYSPAGPPPMTCIFMRVFLRRLCASRAWRGVHVKLEINPRQG